MELPAMLAQEATPLNRMLFLLFILAMVGVVGITALLLVSAIRRSRAMRESDAHTPGPSPKVDAWSEAGRRAEPLDEDEMHPASDRYEDSDEDDEDDDEDEEIWEDDEDDEDDEDSRI